MAWICLCSYQYSALGDEYTRHRSAKHKFWPALSLVELCQTVSNFVELCRTVSNFVEERLVTENAITETTTTKEMHEEYSKFCLSGNLTMEPELVFSKELKSVFESTENVRASNSILDSSGKKVRGYRGVKIKGN